MGASARRPRGDRGQAAGHRGRDQQPHAAAGRGARGDGETGWQAPGRSADIQDRPASIQDRPLVPGGGWDDTPAGPAPGRGTEPGDGEAPVTAASAEAGDGAEPDIAVASHSLSTNIRRAAWRRSRNLVGSERFDGPCLRRRVAAAAYIPISVACRHICPELVFMPVGDLSPSEVVAAWPDTFRSAPARLRPRSPRTPRGPSRAGGGARLISTIRINGPAPHGQASGSLLAANPPVGITGRQQRCS